MNHAAHYIGREITKPAYNNKSLTKWARKMFEGVEGADKIKIKTNSAPKDQGMFYEGGGIYYYKNLVKTGAQSGKNIYISRNTYDRGLEWLYLVTGHEILHYSFEKMGFPSSVYLKHHHLTIFDWAAQQLEFWGIKSGYMYEQVNGALNQFKNQSNYETARNYGLELGIDWTKTGINLIERP